MPHTPRILVSTALAAILGSSVTAAQQTQPTEQMTDGRLTVRPHTMATGTRTDSAGLIALPGFQDYYLYVPKQCVGTKRVPLFVLIHGGGRSGMIEEQKFQPLADKYGVIVLYPTSPIGHWQMGANHGDNEQLHTVDSAIKVVLRTNAIDPNRIALLGFSEGGASSMYLGRNNLDIFSRVAPMSFFGIRDREGPANTKTQFLVSGGIAEGMVTDAASAAHILRADGHQVVTLLGLRGHVDHVEDEDFVWDWILKSWADPSITARMNAAPTDSDPLLTVDAMKKMTDFWTRFKQEPDSVLEEGRMAHQERMHFMLGAEPASVITMDIVAMAKAYPSVAADLKAAGLTAEQEAALREAILRVGFARATGIAPGGNPDNDDGGPTIAYAPIAPTSVLGKNLAFRAAHDTEFNALGKTGMWTTQ